MKKDIKTYNYKLMYIVGLTLLCSTLFTACEDFLEIDAPRDEVVTETIFSTDQTTIGALRGLYFEANLGLFESVLNSGVEQYTGISCDEIENLDIENVNAVQIAANNVSIENEIGFRVFWTNSYRLISLANTIIDGVQNNEQISIEVRDQVLGEALFLRALIHFHLANIFGDVPYADTSDVATLNTLSRDPLEDVYAMIIEDLLEARFLMVDDYSHTGGDRVRANQSAATALLARVYLYLEDWSNAELEATNLISNGTFILEPDLNNIFLSNNSESILQLDIDPDGAGGAITRYGQFFVMPTEGFFGFIEPGAFANFGAYSITDELLAAFEPGDLRFDNWVGVKSIFGTTWHFPFKYKRNPFNFGALATQPIEDFVLFRLAEQYLIRAEARAHLNDISGAQSDINAIRNRAGLGNTTAVSQSALLDAVAQERRIELMVEGGHRWYDLKRTNTIDAVLGALKPGWQSTDALFPIPIQEILNNPNLTQNPGY